MTGTNIYIYAFPASLVFITVFAVANVIRSLSLRRRDRLVMEEAMRNGTWVPTSQLSRPFVDLAQKPVIWDAYIDVKGNLGAIGTQEQLYTAGKGIKQDWWAAHARDWDTMRPLSAAYLVSDSTDRVQNVAESPSTTGPTPAPILVPEPIASQLPPAPNVNANLESRERSFLSRILKRTPVSTSALPAPVASGTDADVEAGHVMTELDSYPNKAMRVAVLIAMPAPPSHSASSSACQHGSSAHTSQCNGGDEDRMPHLEMGIAEVLVMSHESSDYVGSSTRRNSGKQSVGGSSRESEESDITEEHYVNAP